MCNTTQSEICWASWWCHRLCMVPWVYELLLHMLRQTYFWVVFIYFVYYKWQGHSYDKWQGHSYGEWYWMVYYSSSYIMDFSRSYICIVASGQLHQFKTNALHVSFLSWLYNCFIENNPLMIYVCLYKLLWIHIVCKLLWQPFWKSEMYHKY